MRMIVPAIVADKIEKVQLGQEQTPGFVPIIAARVTHPDYGVPQGQDFNGHVVAFALTDDERAAIANGADLYICQMSFAQAFHAILPVIGAGAMADVVGAEHATKDVLTSRVLVARQAARKAMQVSLDAIAERSQMEGQGIVAGPEHERVYTAEMESLHAVDVALGALARARLDAGVGLEAL